MSIGWIYAQHHLHHDLINKLIRLENGNLNATKSRLWMSTRVDFHPTSERIWITDGSCTIHACAVDSVALGERMFELKRKIFVQAINAREASSACDSELALRRSSDYSLAFLETFFETLWDYQLKITLFWAFVFNFLQQKLSDSDSTWVMRLRLLQLWKANRHLISMT